MLISSSSMERSRRICLLFIGELHFFFGRIADDVAFPDPAKNGLSVADRPNASQSRKLQQNGVRQQCVQPHTLKGTFTAHVVMPHLSHLVLSD